MGDLWTQLGQSFDLDTLLAQNEFFQGGLVLAVLSFVGYQFKSLPLKLWALVKRKIIVDVEVRSPLLFIALAEWFAEHPYASKHCRRFIASFGPIPMIQQMGPSSDRGDLTLSPGNGNHFFRHKHRWWWLIRDREGSGGEGQMGGMTMFKEYYFTLRTVGLSAKPAWTLLREVEQWYLSRQKVETGVRIFQNGAYGWTFMAGGIMRDLDSVILPGDLAQRIAADAEQFAASKERYAGLGIPYRRGYLFEGPPGSGKSSLAAALASHLGVNLYGMSLTAIKNDGDLMDLISDVPLGAILLIEDVDCAFEQRKKKGQKEGGITFSGLLNALDGIGAKEGRILVLTTNHPEKLDPALIRPGRVDKQFHFPNASGVQAAELYRRFYPEAGGDWAVQAAVEGMTVSMAALQGHFMAHEDGAEAAVATLPELAPA